jgi:zinc transporter, ZIP family
MPTENLLFAFGLTLFAGLATGVGSAIAFFTRHTNTRFLSVALGFSAGVMIFISLAELLPEAQEGLAETLGSAQEGAWAALAAFVAGILLIGIIDRLVPSFENPHEMHKVEEIAAVEKLPQDARLLRMGYMTAIAIAIHNFPEGLATFAVALHDPALGVSIAVAIAIHNIPEGIAISVPIYYATRSRAKAFFLSFASGLAEPLGAVVGFLILRPFFSETLSYLLFAGVAGIMVYISFDELLPAAREYGEHHLSLYGLVVGMLVMATSLILFL